MSMTSESDERLIPKNSVDSPSLDDANSGGSGGGSVPLKKGPWTSTEDATLIEYVTKHGEGNWNAVQKHSGLARCGKSCRLRWANHLRPDLKKGAFTPEEERRIIELHAKMGNKWARMAAELPGRTDNEIKNYWNTRSKRRQRAGLPPYPPEIRLQAIKENQQIDDMNSFSSGDTHHSGFMPLDSFDIPSFGSLNQQFYPSPLLEIPAGSLLDMPPSSLLAPSLPSSYTHNCFLPTVHPSKRLRGSGPFFPGLNSAISNAISSGIQYQNVGSVQTGQPYNLSSSYDHHLTSTHAPFSSVVPGSHAALNGNPSSSEPAWAMKLELPSLQTQMGSLGSPSSPLPSLESVDTLIQTPPAENTQICNLSPRNSGLLDAVLYESHTMKNTKTGSRQQTSHASDMAHNVMYSSSQDFYETEWEAYGETLSPLGHSSSSVFSEGTPFSGNSSDEPQSVETLPGFNAQNANLFPMQYDIKAETPDDLIFSRPDFLLASSCFSKGGTLPWTNPCSKMQ